MQQQHQILQSLNQCYSQLQQQHQDMATLQQQFQQLFTYNPSSALGNSNPSPHRPQTASPSIFNNASPSFMSLPSHSGLQPPFSAPLFSQAPFTSAYQPPSSAPVFRTAWHPQFGQQVGGFYESVMFSFIFCQIDPLDVKCVYGLAKRSCKKMQVEKLSTCNSIW